MLSRGQALGLGLSQDAVYRCGLSGIWVPVLPGVYRVGGAPPSWHQRVMAACLWAGEGCAASHGTAGALWALDGFEPGVVEISSSGDVRARGLDVIVHRSQWLRSTDLTKIGPIPVTTPARTLMDLGAVVGPDLVEGALDDALRQRLVTVIELKKALERHCNGRRGAGVLRHLLGDRGPGQAPPESVLERRLIDLLRRCKLPEPVRQYEVRERGKLVARVDFAYPQALLAIEADGYAYHSGHRAWRNDRVRRNALTSRGWLVLHVTWDDLVHCPEEIVAEIGASLGARPRFSRSEYQRR